MSDTPITYTDLQVRVLEQNPTPDTEEAVLVAATVTNTGTDARTEHVEQVHLFVVADQGGLAPVLVATTSERLEGNHSHRVRFTIAGADLARAGDGGAPGITGSYRVQLGSSADDIRVEETITLG